MMRQFDSGATRDDDTNKLDYEGFLSPEFVTSFAEYMHKHRVQADGQLRDSDNWQKGIPPDAYMKSLFRHFIEVWTLWRANEKSLSPAMVEALCAMTFNVQGLITTALRDQRLEEAFEMLDRERNERAVKQSASPTGSSPQGQTSLSDTLLRLGRSIPLHPPSPQWRLVEEANHTS